MPSNQVPTEFLTLIGAIIAQYNLLDNLLTAVLVEITGNDSMRLRSHVPFANLPFGMKKIMLDLLIKTQEGIASDSPLCAYNAKFRQVLENTQSNRNKIAHSVWTATDEGKVTRRKLRAKKIVEIETVTIELSELIAILQSIEDCRENLIEIVLHLRGESLLPQSGQKEKMVSNALRAVSEE